MRYLPLTPADRAQMLGVIGAPDIDALFRDVPAAARKADLFDLPRRGASSEHRPLDLIMEIEGRALGDLAARLGLSKRGNGGAMGGAN